MIMMVISVFNSTPFSLSVHNEVEQCYSGVWKWIVWFSLLCALCCGLLDWLPAEFSNKQTLLEKWTHVNVDKVPPTPQTTLLTNGGRSAVAKWRKFISIHVELCIKVCIKQNLSTISHQPSSLEAIHFSTHFCDSSSFS